MKLRAYLDFSGPAVATLFHRLLALVFLDAWLSLSVQLRVLIGARGLLPIASFLEQTRSQLGAESGQQHDASNPRDSAHCGRWRL